MILDTHNRSLQIRLGEARATAASDVTACYAQSNAAGSFVTTLNHTSTNGTTPVTVVPAPGVGLQFLVNEVRLHNNDSITHSVILQLVDGATTRIVYTGAVQPGGDFVYTPEVGAVGGAGGGGGTAGVSTWNARSGSVTMTLGDVTGAGGAPLASPVFTGSPVGPTVTPASDSSTKLATTQFVQNAIGAVSSGVTNIVAGSGLTGGGTGAVTVSVATNGITNALAAQMASNTIKGNNTAGTANAIDLTTGQAMTMLGAAPLSGATFTGPITAPAVTVSAPSGPTTLVLNGPAGTSRYERAQTAGSDRWTWGVSNAAESGSQVGSDWFLYRYTDIGTYIDPPILVTRATGIVTLADGLVSPSYNGGQLAGFRNVIINGSFDVWQRGVSFSTPASYSYTADRWQMIYDGTASTFSVARGSTQTVQAWVDLGFTSYLSYTCSVAGSGGTYRQLVQRIENVRTLSGRTITVSFYASADASRTIAINWLQVFGTGGSPSGSVGGGAGQNVTLTTTVTRFSATFTLPSIVNKTLGTNNDSFLQIFLALPINTTCIINVCGFQVEPGDVATPFEWRPWQTEVALCQRYCLTGSFVHWAYASAAGQTLGSSMAFPVQMRGTPTTTLSAPSLVNCTGLVVWATWNGGFGYYAASSAAGGLSMNANYTAAAEL